MFKITSIILISVAGLQAQAQMMGQTQWGSGQWGGTQSCYSQPSQNRGQGMGQASPQGGPQNGQPDNEELKELSAQIADAKKQIKSKKSEKQHLDRDLERAKEDVNGLISEDYSNFIFEHIENNRQCHEYKGYNKGATEEAAAESLTPIQSFSAAQWSQLCDANKSGSISSGVCDAQAFRHGERSSSPADCKKGLSDYRKGYQQSQKLQGEIDRLTRSIERLNDHLKQAKADAKEAQKEARLAKTEGDFCVECARAGNGYSAPQSQTNWGNVLANAGVGIMAMSIGHQNNQMIADSYASAGLPTPYLSSSWTAGIPYIYNAVNGALGGCNASTGGAFGYPQSMMGLSNMTGVLSGMMGLNNMTGNSLGMSTNSPVMMQYQMQQYQTMLQYQQMYQQQMYQQQMLSSMYSSYSPYSNISGSLGLYGTAGLYGNGYTGTSGYAGGLTSGYYYTGYSGPGTPVYSSSALGSTGYTSGIPGSAIYYGGGR